MNQQAFLPLGIALLMLATLSSSCYGQNESTKPEKIDYEASAPNSTDSPPTVLGVSLSTYEYEVVDTAEYVTFRLYVRNTSDSLVVIDRVEPSCGCILTTIQKRFARKEKDGEIYIGLSTERMSDTQPYIVDVYTTQNPESPMRLYIRKKLSNNLNQVELKQP